MQKPSLIPSITGPLTIHCAHHDEFPSRLCIAIVYLCVRLPTGLYVMRAETCTWYACNICWMKEEKSSYLKLFFPIKFSFLLVSPSLLMPSNSSRSAHWRHQQNFPHFLLPKIDPCDNPWPGMVSGSWDYMISWAIHSALQSKGVIFLPKAHSYNWVGGYLNKLGIVTKNRRNGCWEDATISGISINRPSEGWCIINFVLEYCCCHIFLFNMASLCNFG